MAVRPGPSSCDRQYEKAEELDACFAYDADAKSCPDHLFNAFAQGYIARICTAPEEPRVAALIEPEGPEIAAHPEPKAPEDKAHGRTGSRRGASGGCARQRAVPG